MDKDKLDSQRTLLPPDARPGDKECVIVVPCYNEASRLDADAFRAFARREDCYQFLFVDDGSRDGTAQALDQLCHDFPQRFRLLRLPRNRGKAEAVRQGVLHALDGSPSLVGYWDADLATPLEAVPQLCGVLREREALQIVLGSRIRLLGRSIQRRAIRHYVGRVFATAASLILDLPVYDTQCGAKLFRVTPHTRPLFEQPFRASWAFDVELLARYLELHGRPVEESPSFGIFEFPLDCWQDIRGSKVGLQGAAAALAGLFHVFWHHRVKNLRPRRHSTP